MNFYTADTHFFHKNVIEYCNRPFTCIEDMNEKIIEKWNMTVKADDSVFLLGDFSFGKKAQTKEVRERLNGNITLIVGNHDHKDTRKLFPLSFYAWDTRIGSWHITMSHYPFPPKEGEDFDARHLDRRQKDNGQILLHGHVHCAWKKRGRMINVGCDVWNFAPVSELEILDLIEKGEDA